MTKEEIDKLPEIMTVDEARKIVNIGKTAMYELIRMNKDFPAIKLGPHKTRIIKTDFLEWIKKQYESKEDNSNLSEK